MALSMLEAIRDIDDKANITWVCASTVASLLQSLNCVHELIVVDEHRLFGKQGVLPAVYELAKVCVALMGRSYDLVVTGHRDYRLRLLSSTVRCAERRSFGSSWPVPGRYYGDEHVRLITGTDGPASKHARLPVVELPLCRSLDTALRGIQLPLIALAPGGAKNVLRDQPLKRWPLSLYVELASRARALGWGVVITGTASEEWVCAPFRELAALDLVGKTSLVDLVAVYNRCSAVVTHDSGPMHLAALAGTPLVALFGPTDPAWFAARRNNVRVLWGGSELACRPCYDGRDYARCPDNLCMRSITVEAVVDALSELVRFGNRRQPGVESSHPA